MTKIEIRGELTVDDDITHEDFIYRLMAALRSKDIRFKGNSKIIEEVKVYKIN